MVDDAVCCELLSKSWDYFPGLFQIS